MDSKKKQEEEAKKEKEAIAAAEKAKQEAEEREARRRMLLGDEYAEGEYKPGMYIRERRLLRMQARERERAQRSKRTAIRTVIFLGCVVLVLYLMFTYFGRAF